MSASCAWPPDPSTMVPLRIINVGVVSITTPGHLLHVRKVKLDFDIKLQRLIELARIRVKMGRTSK